MSTYANLPLAQRRTQQIVDQFNAAEELWRALEAKRRRRRARYSKISSELHRQLDQFDFAYAQSPQDCVGFGFDVSRILEKRRSA